MQGLYSYILLHPKIGMKLNKSKLLELFAAELVPWAS